MDAQRCWEHVDLIIDFMDKGFRFLAPEEVTDEVNQSQKDALYDDSAIEEDEKAFVKL